MKAKQTYLTPKQVAQFLQATKTTRHPARNYLLFLLLYRHGLRCSELIDLRRKDIDLDDKRIHVRRLKNGLTTYHPLQPDTIRAIRAHLDSQPPSKFLFESERGPFTRTAINYLCREIGNSIGLKVNPHLFRHSCGYAMANKGHDLRLIQDYLGHTDIRSTVIYTAVCPERFKELWK